MLLGAVNRGQQNTWKEDGRREQSRVAKIRVADRDNFFNQKRWYRKFSSFFTIVNDTFNSPTWKGEQQKVWNCQPKWTWEIHPTGKIHAFPIGVLSPFPIVFPSLNQCFLSHSKGHPENKSPVQLMHQVIWYSWYFLICNCRQLQKKSEIVGFQK